MNIKEELLKIFNDDNFNQPLTIDELNDQLHLSSSEDFITLCKAVNELEDEFVITHSKKNRFAPLSFFNLVVGTYKSKNGDYGFVDDYYVSRKDNLNALNNDLVLLKKDLDQLGRTKGIITRIIKRNTTKFYGQIVNYRKKYFLKLFDKNNYLDIIINNYNDELYQIGDYVEAKIVRYFDNNQILVNIVKVISHKNDMMAPLTMILLSNKINIDFSDEALIELKDVDKEIDNEFKKRRFIDRKIITIDSLSAKDLDDAISVDVNGDGTYNLGVYIADVSYFVKENSFLDLDALDRGTSVYLPDRVIPMLPEKLSNDLCSLNEDTYKLVMACEMIIDKEGNVINSDIFEGYIRTLHRMNYDDCNEILAGNSDLINKYQDIYDLLINANNLAKILNQKRIDNGSFEFEDNEVEFIFDDSYHVIDIKKRIRGESERIIEEFMLQANVTVAETMYHLDVPFIYRIHDLPNIDKLNNTLMMLSSFNINDKPKNDKDIAHFLNKILLANDPKEVGIKEEEKIKREIINKFIIRSMAKAVYSNNNIGHFGLQFKNYTHFTSPIRRYPDLLVHRLIKTFLLNEKEVDDPLSYYEVKVVYASNKSSDAEKRAELCEREADDYKKCEYMEHFIGQSFEGIISSILPFGFFVMLSNNCEGLVRIESVTSDYYEYDQIKCRFTARHINKSFNIGDKVKIKVQDVNLTYREIDFKLIERRE